MTALGVDAHRSLLSHEKGIHSSEPVKPKGFAFLVSSPCSCPVTLTCGLCDSCPALGYSRVVDGAGGRHSAAVCSQHGDVACAHTSVFVIVQGLQQVVVADWVVTTRVYALPHKLSKLLRQQGPQRHLQAQQGH